MTRRLLLSYLSITVFVLVILEIPLAVVFADRERDRLIVGIERDAVVLATIYEDALQLDVPYSPQPAIDYALDTDTRVVVVDAAGISIVDTERSPNRDFSNREEITIALGGARATGSRFSETLGRDLLYVAVPVASGGTVHGAVRVTISPAEVEARIHRFWWGLAGVGAVVLAAMAVVGWVIARSMAHPVKALRRATSQAAAGDLTVAIDPGDAPAELRELAHSFNNMSQRLGELVGKNRAFVADASHQLRTPLTALRLRLENLEESTGNDDASAALGEIDRLGRIVDQLLSLARAEEARRAPMVTDLTEVVGARIEQWRAGADDQGVSLLVERGPGRLLVNAVPEALDQILDNLLANALAVTEPGGSITVRTEPGTAHHTLEVIDTGPGLSSEELDRAFDRFWRGRHDTGGSGLGLAIVRELARASGGTATLEANGPHGVRAVVRLPAAQV